MAKKESLGRFCKERMVDEMVLRFKERPNFFITSFMGLSNAELELLRKNLKRSLSSYFVVKNAILKIVFDKLDLKDTAQPADAGIGISLSGEDVMSACKALVGFTKEHDKLKLKGAYLDGKNISPERVSQLASLPTKDVLLAQVVGGIKSPITGFANTLSGILRKFVYAIDAIKRSKQKITQS